MNISTAIAQAQLQVRRDTFIQTPEWKQLLNAVCMDFAAQTGILEADFELTMAESVVEYDVSEAGLYQLTEDPTYNGATIARVSRAKALQDAGYDLTTEGTPTTIYPVTEMTFGLYPVPDETCNADTMVLHGKCFPAEITVDTAVTTTLPFEVIDHPRLVSGLVVFAERIDRDINASREVRADYEQGIMKARHRAAARMPATSRMRVSSGR